jgi:hypothetical protein
MVVAMCVWAYEVAEGLLLGQQHGRAVSAGFLPLAPHGKLRGQVGRHGDRLLVGVAGDRGYPERLPCQTRRLPLDC